MGMMAEGSHDSSHISNNYENENQKKKKTIKMCYIPYIICLFLFFSLPIFKILNKFIF